MTGAGQPEYMITADDCESKVMINCVPMDEHSRQGEVVTVVANDGKSISQDPMMKDQIDNYIANNYASFDVQFQEGTSEESQELATFVLRRSTYELRRNGSRQVISEKYAIDASVCCCTTSPSPKPIDSLPLSFNFSSSFLRAIFKAI
jgi:hypothetical protein